LFYDPTDGPVACSGNLEIGRNNCDEPYDKNISIDPPRCESACGASPECDERNPNSDVGTGTCDSNCQYKPYLETGLGTPIIDQFYENPTYPLLPKANEPFYVYCPTNGNQQYDCIDAYANIINGNPVDRCSWITGGGGWIEDKAVFSCSKRVVGTYTAVCKTRPTSSNCKQLKQKNDTVFTVMMMILHAVKVLET
jgi:hypothetical protein